jgi:Bacterial PH domain
MFPLQQNEIVKMYVRRHWIWLALDAVIAILVFIIPVSISILLSNYVFTDKDLFFDYPVIDLLDLFIYVWAIFSWIYFADRFTKYALNFWVLTNKRLVESEHIYLFSRKLSTLPLETIEDVTVKYDGLLENVIGFGSLTVQTAGTQREFLADDINDPEKVKQEIFNAREGLKEEDRQVTVENSSEIGDDFKEAMLKNNLNNAFENSNNKANVDLEVEHNFDLPHDQRVTESKYDWAHINDRQHSDVRNINEQIEIDENFKKDIDKALRYE